MRLGIFGGTFDPPHIGHLILAAECLDQLELTRVLWVVTSNPPHKQGQQITVFDYRLKMVEAAIENNPYFMLSRVDVDRPPPHYALDTVRLLRQANPGATMIYLMGGDSLVDLPDWHRPRDFLEECDVLGIMRRPGEVIDLSGLSLDLPGIQEKVSFVDAPLLEISSSQIRQRVAEGKSYQYYLSPQVFRLIQEYKLYRTA